MGFEGKARIFFVGLQCTLLAEIWDSEGLGIPSDGLGVVVGMGRLGDAVRGFLDWSVGDIVVTCSKFLDCRNHHQARRHRRRTFGQ